MELRTVDACDDRAFGDWYSVLAQALADSRPGEPDWMPHEQQRIALDGSGRDPDTAQRLVTVHDGERPVGAARLSVPRRDNLHLGELVLAVVPEARRRGVGTRLLQEVERLARADGRTTVVAMADEPPGRDRVVRAAALARGFRVVQSEVRRDIDLPLDAARVAGLERTCREHAAAYDVVVWESRAPDEWVDDLVEMSRLMSTDVPKDEVAWEEEVWDAARFRRSEQLAADMDRGYVGAGAVHRDSGRMVAFTTNGFPRQLPERAYQWETLVVREHRGHRLGLLVKLAALQHLSRTSPATRYITTWNAQENHAMIAVNDALGARTNGDLVALQKEL